MGGGGMGLMPPLKYAPGPKLDGKNVKYIGNRIPMSKILYFTYITPKSSSS